MLDRTAAFDKALLRGAPVVAPQLTVIRAGVGQGTYRLLPGATIQMDENAASRRTFTGTLANAGGLLAPLKATDPLAPYGIEGTVTVGLILPDGSQEIKQLGVFRLNVVGVDTNGLITVSGPDRSQVVAANLNQAPYTIPANTPLDDAVTQYLQSKYPSLPVLMDAGLHDFTTPATPVVYEEGSNSGNPWSNCEDLLNDAGRELFIDSTGRAVGRVIPDPTMQVPVFDYDKTTGLVTTGTHTIDTSSVINIAIVETTGSATITTPVSGQAEITDPTSPIFPDPNVFGIRVSVTQSTTATTSDQCVAAAQGILNRKYGSDHNIQFSAVPNPCHEPGDVVHFQNDLLGVDYNLVLSAFQLQIDLLAATAYTTRLSTSGSQGSTEAI